MGRPERPNVGIDAEATQPGTGGPVTVLYFASVREGIGLGSEKFNLPATVTTVGQFVEWLRARGPAYDAALAPNLGIHAAVDRVHANPTTPIDGATEIAIFPMMTGG